MSWRRDRYKMYNKTEKTILFMANVRPTLANWKDRIYEWFDEKSYDFYNWIYDNLIP